MRTESRQYADWSPSHLNTLYTLECPLERYQQIGLPAKFI